MKRTLAIAPFACAAILYLGVVTTLYLRQTEIEFPADRTPIHLPTDNPLHLTPITLTTSDHLTLKAWYRAPEGSNAVILMLHGNAGNLNDTWDRLTNLSIPGYGLLAVEYRGYGGNPGTPDEPGLAKDADAAMTFLQTSGIPAQRVVVYGHSLGTGVATALARRWPVAALVLDSPFTSIAAVAQSRYWYLPAGLLLRSKFSVLPLLPGLKAPLLILQGAKDRTVPPAMGRADFSASPEPKLFWCAPEAGHMDALKDGGAIVLRTFLSRYVQNTQDDPPNASNR